jgi:hypothetical protein
VAKAPINDPKHWRERAEEARPSTPGDGVVLSPAIGSAVGAAHKQPVQHREEHRALQRKTVDVAAALNDLQIGAPEVLRRKNMATAPRPGALTESRFDRKKSNQITQKRGTTLS